jgi:hypothetical protein
MILEIYFKSSEKKNILECIYSHGEKFLQEDWEDHYW